MIMRFSGLLPNRFVPSPFLMWFSCMLFCLAQTTEIIMNQSELSMGGILVPQLHKLCLGLPVKATQERMTFDWHQTKKFWPTRKWELFLEFFNIKGPIKNRFRRELDCWIIFTVFTSKNIKVVVYLYSLPLHDTKYKKSSGFPGNPEEEIIIMFS